MAAGDEYLAWQRQREQQTRPRPRPRSQSARPGSRPPSAYFRQTPGRGPGQSAAIPAQDWVAPIPRHSGISQEPNSPWGFAIHDPLERQFITMTPAGFPVLRNRIPPRPTRPVVGSVASSSWSPDYYPSGGYGGGGGGGGGWSYPSSVQAPYWWDPGLYNWRYGVSM